MFGSNTYAYATLKGISMLTQPKGLLDLASKSSDVVKASYHRVIPH